MTVAVTPMIMVMFVTGVSRSAGATTPSRSLPLVSVFKVSPNSLSNNGGTVKLKADLKFAKTCTLSVSQPVKGLPQKNFACGVSSFSKSFTIGKDTNATPRSYVFSLSVKNAEGKTAAPNAIVAEGAAPPPISFGITNENFGTVGVLIHSRNIEVEVTNNSTQPQNLGQFGIVGTNASDFGLPSNDCAGIVLSPKGGECSFAVDFIPTSTGKRVATLELGDLSWGSTGANALLPLSGAGVFSEISISASSAFYSGGNISFGVQGVDTTTSPYYVTVTDASGTVPLYVGTIGVSGQNYTDFLVGGGNCGNTVIDPGAQCQFTVNFVPTASGLRKAQVDVYGNMSGGVWTIPESGEGQYATLALDNPPSTPIAGINFGSETGPTVSVSVTVTNTSSDVFLAFGSQSAVSGQNAPLFTWLPNNCAYSGAELAPNQSCTFIVNFIPGQNGQPGVFYQGIFSLYDNAQSGSQTLTLQGTETPTS
ncbi:MAG: choice-of-anchor D domain-containing protein [Acidimicrobiales bacterium]|jgi:hypothetical protein